MMRFLPLSGAFPGAVRRAEEGSVMGSRALQDIIKSIEGNVQAVGPTIALASASAVE